MPDKRTTFNLVPQFFYTILGVLSGMIGYTIHGSLFWSMVDFCFFPVAWAKWLICHQVSMQIIRHTFEFFLN